VKTAAPPSIGWQENAREAFSCGAAPVLAEVLAKDAEDIELLTVGLQQLGAMAAAGCAKEMLPQITVGSHSILSTFTAFWASVSKTASGAGAPSDDERSAIVSASRSFGGLALGVAAAAPDAAVEAGLLHALVFFLPRSSHVSDSGEDSRLPEDGMHAPSAVAVALQAVSACTRSRAALPQLSEPAALAALVDACRVFDSESMASNRHLMHGFKVMDRLSRSDVGLAALRLDGTLVARLAPSVEWAQRWPAVGAVGVRVLTRIVGQDIATLIAKAGGTAPDGSAVPVREAVFTAGLLASLSSDATIAEQLLADEGALLSSVLGLVSLEAPSARVAFFALQCTRRAVASSRNAAEIAMAQGAHTIVQAYICNGLVRDDGILSEGVGLLSELASSKEHAEAIDNTGGGDMHAWVLEQLSTSGVADHTVAASVARYACALQRVAALPSDAQWQQEWGTTLLGIMMEAAALPSLYYFGCEVLDAMLRGPHAAALATPWLRKHLADLVVDTLRDAAESGPGGTMKSADAGAASETPSRSQSMARMATQDDSSAAAAALQEEGAGRRGSVMARRQISAGGNKARKQIIPTEVGLVVDAASMSVLMMQLTCTAAAAGGADAVRRINESSIVSALLSAYQTHSGNALAAGAFSIAVETLLSTEAIDAAMRQLSGALNLIRDSCVDRDLFSIAKNELQSANLLHEGDGVSGAAVSGSVPGAALDSAEHLNLLQASAVSQRLASHIILVEGVPLLVTFLSILTLIKGTSTLSKPGTASGKVAKRRSPSTGARRGLGKLKTSVALAGARSIVGRDKSLPESFQEDLLVSLCNILTNLGSMGLSSSYGAHSRSNSAAEAVLRRMLWTRRTPVERVAAVRAAGTTRKAAGSTNTAATRIASAVIKPVIAKTAVKALTNKVHLSRVAVAATGVLGALAAGHALAPSIIGAMVEASAVEAVTTAVRTYAASNLWVADRSAAALYSLTLKPAGAEAVSTRGASRQFLRELVSAFGSGDKKGKASIAERWLGQAGDGAGDVGPAALMSTAQLLEGISSHEVGASLLKKQGTVDVLLSTLDGINDGDADSPSAEGRFGRTRTVLIEVLTRLVDASSVTDAQGMLQRLTAGVQSGKVKLSTVRTAGVALTTLQALASSADGSAVWAEVAETCQALLSSLQGVTSGQLPVPAGVKLEQLQPLETQVVQLLSSLLSSVGDDGGDTWSSVALSSVPLLLSAMESGAASALSPVDLLKGVASAVKSADAAVAVMNNDVMLDSIFSLLTAAVDDWDATAVAAGMDILASCAKLGTEQCQALFERGAHLLSLRAANDAFASAPAHADSWGPGSAADIAASCMSCASAIVQAVPAAAHTLNRPEVEGVGLSLVTVVGRGITRVCAAEQPYAPHVMGAALELMNAVQGQVCSVEGEEVVEGAQSPAALSASCRKVVASAVKAAALTTEYATDSVSGLQLAKALKVNCCKDTAHVADEDALDDVCETFKQLGARQLMVTCVSKSGVDSALVAAASTALASLDGGAADKSASGLATEVRKLTATLRKLRSTVQKDASTDASSRTAAVRLVRASTRLQGGVNRLSTSLAVDTALSADIADVVVQASAEAVMATIANVHTLGEVAHREYDGGDEEAAGGSEEGDADDVTIVLEPQVGLDAARSTLAALLQCVSRAWLARGSGDAPADLHDKYIGGEAGVTEADAEVASLNETDQIASPALFGLVGGGADCLARMAVLLVQFGMRWFTIGDEEGIFVPADAEAQAVALLAGAREVVLALLGSSNLHDVAQGWDSIAQSGLLSLLSGLARDDIEWPESVRPAAHAAWLAAVQAAIQHISKACSASSALPVALLPILPLLLLLVACESPALCKSVGDVLLKAVPAEPLRDGGSAALAQLWAVVYSMLQTPVRLHPPRYFVDAADCSISIFEGEDAAEDLPAASPATRAAISLLVGSISQAPLPPDAQQPAFDEIVLTAVPAVLHTCAFALQFIKEKKAAAGASTPSKRRSLLSASGQSPSSVGDATEDDEVEDEEAEVSASWWFKHEPCLPIAGLESIVTMPAIIFASHMDLDVSAGGDFTVGKLVNASDVLAPSPNGEALFTAPALEGLKRVLLSGPVQGTHCIQLLRRMAGLKPPTDDGNMPMARDRVLRLAEAGMLAAVTAGLAAASSSAGSSSANKEELDVSALQDKELFTCECVRFLADVAMGGLLCAPLSSDVKDTQSAQLVNTALVGSDDAGVGVKQCGFSETSLAVLGAALKRLTLALDAGDHLVVRAAVLVAALGRVFESYSSEGFLKAIKEAAEAAAAATSASSVPPPPGGADGVSPPEVPQEGGATENAWEALVKKFAVLHRVCVNVDMDAIPEVSPDVLRPLVELGMQSAFRAHEIQLETLVFALSRCGDNAHNLTHAVGVEVHSVFAIVLKEHMANVVLVDLCITGLRPMTIPLQFLPQLKRAGVVPLVTEAAKTHVDAILQTPPHRRLVDDEEDEYPRIAHYSVQILANIACDKEIEKASDVMGVQVDPDTDQVEDEVLSGGVLRVVLADGIEALRCVMLAHITNPRILEDAMCALSNMAFTTDAVRLAIGRQCALTVVESLKVFDSDPYLFSMALRAVGNLTRCDENIVSVMAFGVGVGIESGMRKCADFPDALQVAADVVGNLASIDENHLDKVEAVKALKEGIKRREVSDGSTTKDMGLDDLMQLDLAIAVAEWLYDEGVPQALAATMRANYAEASIVSACLRAIQYLTETPSVLLRLTKHTSLAQDVVFVLRSCDYDAELCLRGGFLLAQMLKPFVQDEVEQEAIAAVTRQACIDAGVQTVLLSIVETHRREEYVVSQLMNISNLASKGEHLKDMCTAAVQMKTHTSLLWIAQRAAFKLYKPEELPSFDSGEATVEARGKASGGAAKPADPGVIDEESEQAGVVMDNRSRTVEPSQLCTQALGLLCVWAENSQFSDAAAAEIGATCIKLYRLFDTNSDHPLQYAVLRLLTRVAESTPSALALARTAGVPELLGQFCWDSERMLTDKWAQKAIEMAGYLVHASRQAASLCKAAGVHWMLEALALRYAILEQEEMYSKCGPVIKTLYMGAEKFNKLAATQKSSGGGGRRLLLSAVAEGDEEGGESEEEEAAGEDDITGCAEDMEDVHREWRARAVAGLVPYAQFPKDTLGALTAGADLDVWFVPFMHPSGKIKMRIMRVKLDSSLSLVQCMYFSTKSQGKLTWSSVLVNATSIRVGAPTSGIKRKFFGKNAKPQHSLCLDGPLSACLMGTGDGTVMSAPAACQGRKGVPTDDAPVTLLHIELTDEAEAKSVRDVLLMMQSFARSQPEATMEELTRRVNEDEPDAGQAAGGEEDTREYETIEQ